MSKLYKSDEIGLMDTVICMKAVKTNSEDDYALSQLLVATEFK